MLKKPVILPLDGYENPGVLLAEATRVLNEKDSNIIGFVKINDAAHMSEISGPGMVNCLRGLKRDLGVFLDLKLGDTKGTLKNIASHYEHPDILTVSAIIDAGGFLELRKTLPDTELALFSVPTDMNEERCKKRYGMTPAEKIIHDVRCLEEDYADIGKYDFIPPPPFDLIVSSPRELDELKAAGLNKRYKFICPGIRDEWMTKGQQARYTGVAEALEKGAKYVVLGSQMMKGNPDRGVSPQKSRKMTIEEIDAVRAEGGGHA